MQGAPSGSVAAEAAAAPRVSLSHPLETVALLTVLGVLAGAVLAGGGSRSGPLLWIGGAAVLASATGAVGVLAGVLPRPVLGRSGVLLLALLGAFACWSAVTIAWSVEPDRSWDAFNRIAAYGGLLALGALAGAFVREAPRAACLVLAAVLGAALVWALATAVVPALGPDVERSARLREPVGYWNALALLAAMSLPVWLWVRRPLGALGVFAATVVLLLTSSRGGIVVAVVAVGAWLLLVRPRRDALWTLLVSLPPGLAVGAWALTTPVAEAGAPGRGAAGAWLALALLAGGALVVAVARREPPRRTVSAAAALAAAGLLAVAGVAAVQAGDWWDAFRNPPAEQVTNDPGRLAEASSNHRWTWWTQAWEIFADAPLAGAGAGAYEMARRPLREDTRAPLDPHNLVLKAASETGLVGVGLLVGALAAAVAICAAALRRLGGESRRAAAAIAAVAATWLVHSLVDMPWEYVAATAPVAVAVGVLAGAGRSPGARVREPAPLALVPVVAGLALVASLALPWAAQQRTDAALDAILRGNLAAGAETAEDAAALNPLSVRPLHLEATALEAMGRLDEAERLYEEAVRLQPRNPQAWYELGRFEYEARDEPGEALLYLDRSWALDPWPPETGALLDAVRADLATR